MEKESKKTDSDVRKLRLAVGMSQREFSRYFDIPFKTLIKWDDGTNEPAPYIVSMMEAILILRREITSSPLNDD